MLQAIKKFFGFGKGEKPVIEPDTHADPEDPAAYTYVDKVDAVLQADVDFPIQTLRGRKLPTDARPGSDKKLAALEEAPAGYETWVDVYEGPDGVGYVINFEIVKGKDTYRKCVNVGPEKYREQDWTLVDPEPKGLK